MQEAAEKALKAVILAQTGEPPPRTHDVFLLKDLVRHAPLTAEAAHALIQYAALTRYPADLGEVDEAERRQAVADAVVVWAEAQVASDGP